MSKAKDSEKIQAAEALKSLAAPEESEIIKAAEALKSLAASGAASQHVVNPHDGAADKDLGKATKRKRTETNSIKKKRDGLSETVESGTVKRNNKSLSFRNMLASRWVGNFGSGAVGPTTAFGPNAFAPNTAFGPIAAFGPNAFAPNTAFGPIAAFGPTAFAPNTAFGPIAAFGPTTTFAPTATFIRGANTKEVKESSKTEKPQSEKPQSKDRFVPILPRTEPFWYQPPLIPNADLLKRRKDTILSPVAAVTSAPSSAVGTKIGGDHPSPSVADPGASSAADEAKKPRNR